MAYTVVLYFIFFISCKCYILESICLKNHNNCSGNVWPSDMQDLPTTYILYLCSKYASKIIVGCPITDVLVSVFFKRMISVRSAFSLHYPCSHLNASSARKLNICIIFAILYSCTTHYIVLSR